MITDKVKVAKIRTALAPAQLCTYVTHRAFYP